MDYIIVRAILLLPVLTTLAIIILLIRLVIREHLRVPESPAETILVRAPALKPRGLSRAELDKLPKTLGSELVPESECSICLDVIEPEDHVRVLPECDHGFHVHCADAWLASEPFCPLCRSKVYLFVRYCSPC